MGLDLRELLLHRGDGEPCVRAHAGCSRSRRGSMHLHGFHFFVLSCATDTGRYNHRATHPSGWTWPVEKQWAEQAVWCGLPCLLVSLVEVELVEEGRKVNAYTEGCKWSGRDGLGVGGFYTVSAQVLRRVASCTASYHLAGAARWHDVFFKIIFRARVACYLQSTDNWTSGWQLIAFSSDIRGEADFLNSLTKDAMRQGCTENLAEFREKNARRPQYQ